MQGGYAHHLLKRGVHFVNGCMKHRQAQQAHQAVNGRIQIGQETTENPLEELARRFQQPGAIIALGLTFLVFFIFYTAIDYSINSVATNLAIVEDTNGGRVALSAGDEPDATLSKTPLLEDFEGKVPIPEALPTKPITNKLCSIFRHVRQYGGFFARFRGLRFAAFYHIALAVFSALLQAVFSPLGPLGFWFGSTFAAMLCCNVHAAWTHATIAAPSDKPFFQRFLPRSVAKKLMLPTLRLHIAIGVLHGLTVGSAYLAVRVISDSSVPRYVSINMAILPVAVAISTALLAVLPSYIALIRAEASLLPEDMSAIMPFDRTFGGRFLQEFATRREYIFKNLSMRGAWCLFDRETFKRVVKIQAKFFIISLVTLFIFASIFLAEGVIIAGGEQNIKRVFKYVKEHEGF